MTDLLPPKKITLATDLSARSDRAFERAAHLARLFGAELQVVHAVEAAQYAFWTEGPSWQRSPDPVAQAKRKLELEYPGWLPEQSSVVVKNGNPYELVDKAAREFDAGLIVTGIAHDETYGADKLGRMVVELGKRAVAPLLAVKRRVKGDYKRIVVASDLSEASVKALKFAVGAFPEAKITLFHGFDIPYRNQITEINNVERELRGTETEKAGNWLREQLGEAADAIEIQSEMGNLAANLEQYVADKQVDLVVVGSSGRTGLAAAIVGSVALEIIERVDADVLTVRQ